MEREQAVKEGRAPINVLLLGRTRRNVNGGIGRSARMIVDALRSVGDECRLRDVGAPLTDIPSDTDLVWHYGDIDLIDQQIAAAREAGVPVLVNSTFDDRSDRRDWMHAKMEQWDAAARNDVFFAVFSHNAERDLRLHRLWPRLVAVPKTVRAGTDAQGAVSFGERTGICIGDLEKLNRARLVRGMDVGAAIASLQEACPSAKLLAYNQYGTAETPVPPGVEVAARPSDFLAWLATFRLYVSLTRHETFAMVPAEAQSVGTPVLYRHMPQSLTEHLAFTGVVFHDIDELTAVAGCVYHSEVLWKSLSRAGHANARSRSAKTVGAALALALRRMLVRARITS